MTDVSEIALAALKHIATVDRTMGVAIKTHAISKFSMVETGGRQELLDAGIFWRHKTGYFVYTELGAAMANLLLL